MNDKVITKLNEQSEIYTPYLKTPEPQEYKFTSKEYEEITTIKASLDSQITYYEASFIEGNIDINNESNWNSYLSTIKKFNGNKLEDIYNTMLKRYK